jgi:hypothetical protein
MSQNMLSLNFTNETSTSNPAIYTDETTPVHPAITIRFCLLLFIAKQKKNGSLQKGPCILSTPTPK